MLNKLVYSKHSPNERCGVAFFSQVLAKNLSARHIQSFHGFSKCDELYINMDILELQEEEVSSLLNFIKSGNARKTILIMHDYRFSYFEDELIKKCNIVVNLSGEPSLRIVAGNKMIDLFTPGSMEQPILQFQKNSKRPLSLAFGFFSPRKKSFKLYIAFYEYMIEKYPDWYHILVASTHTGHDKEDVNSIARFLDSESILVLNFLPNILLSELISASDLGACFYPTGIMLNNAAPMAFFSQGKPVITTYGELTPKEFKQFTLDGVNLAKLEMSNINHLRKIGKSAENYYWKNLSWKVFIQKMYSQLAKI